MDAVIWRREILKRLARIADAEYQQRAWLGDGPEVSSPDEVFCELYDDLMFDRFLEEQRPFLSSDQLAAANRFKAAMDGYAAASPSHLDARRVLADPGWDDVRAAAKEFMRHLMNDAGVGDA